MARPSDTRTLMAQRFADLLCQYQEDHRHLMHCVMDDKCPTAVISSLNERLHNQLIALKEVKRYLSWLKETDSPTEQTLFQEHAERPLPLRRAIGGDAPEAPVHAGNVAILEQAKRIGTLKSFKIGDDGTVAVRRNAIEFRLTQRQVKGFVGSLPVPAEIGEEPAP